MKTWKKWLTFGMTATLATTFLAACGSNNEAAADGKTTVTLWAGGSDNVKVGMEQVVAAFNESEQGEDYQLKLEFIMSGAGSQSLSDRIIAAKKAGQEDTDYDLILVSDAEYGTYVQEGGDDLFVAYDESNIPNLANVQTQISTGEGVLVPYRGTTVVLAYNSDKVANPPQTADELYQWIKDNPGRFSYNTPGSGGAGGSFVQTAIYNFLPEEAMSSTDETWKAEWNQGFDLLAELHDSMYQSGGKVIYPNKNQGTLDLLINGEVDMIPTWADMMITNLANGTLSESVKMTQIDPGFTGNVDGLAIPSIGSNPEGAQAVMNFFLTEEAQQILLDAMAAIPVIDSANVSSDNSKYLSELNIESFRTISIGNLGSELNEEWDQKIGTLPQ
jgi:putative spermidine/putrescine transport system substrate-binding protein